MNLTITEKFWASDVGRQRSNNEDNYYARPPLFAVSDGMGGAQAGEVASAETVKRFKEGMPDGAAGDALVQMIEEANRRIFDMSRESTERQGMGCTVTAAYLDGEDIVIAHVGDSRAYLLRDGDLIRLTRDHSLVGDLIALGKLTEEEAEHHPQRSVITRALGPEATVKVDLEVYPAREGDVYLICSDGLTSMVSEAEVKSILLSETPLERAGRGLIDAANEAGGRDNITVITFRVGEQTDVTGAAATEGEASEQQATSLSPAVEEPAPSASESDLTPEPASPGPVKARAEPERPRRRGRRLRIAAAVTAALAVILVAGWVATRAVYFVGTAGDGRTVAVFRGLPYELPLGVDLYTTEYTSGATIDQVPERRRSAFLDHKLRSLNDARDLVQRLERGEISQ